MTHPKTLFFALFALLMPFMGVRAQSLYLADQPQPKRESRAVWLTTLLNLDWPKTRATNASSRQSQQQELIHILDRLQTAGINQVLLQTRVRGAGIYPSKIEPWYRSLTGQYDKDPGYDPLKFAIDECHKRGMELHAWVVTIPAFDEAEAKKVGRKGLMNTHPDWLCRHEGKYYLNPGIPAVGDYLASICREIAVNYDVDGIHFDYIRYPENNASFPDGETFRKYGKGASKASWRRANITRIVRLMYQTIKELKPWVKVSSSPVGKFDNLSRYPSRGWDAYNVVFQDAQGWLKEGIHDALYPMMYFKGDHFYPFAADWQENTNNRPIVVGLGTYFLDPSQANWSLLDLTREMNYIRLLGMGGTCHFRYQFLDKNPKGIYDFVRTVYHPFPALPQAMTWIDNTPPSRPKNVVQNVDSKGMTHLSWEPAWDDISGSSVRYNVYASSSWPVDISKAENLIAASLPSPEFSFNQRQKMLRNLYFAVTTMDRCGNESSPTPVDIPPYGYENPDSIIRHAQSKLQKVKRP